MNDVKKRVLRKILSAKALERLGRIRLVKPALANQLEEYLIQLFQAGKIKEINEAQLIQILETISNKKRFRLIR